MSENKLELQKNDPIASGEDDRLGMITLAEHLASISNPSGDSDPLIIGVEGQWGSGKSSLLEMTKQSIIREFRNEFVVVDFAPWLVGNRDGLLNQFFSAIIAAINDSSARQGDFRGAAKAASEDAISALKRFGRTIGPLAGLARAVGDFGIPLAGLAATPLAAIEQASKSGEEEVSLVDRKKEVAEQIRKIGKRFVVFIDDIDRLEPQEISEIFRLVRAVLDLQDFTYIISYDKGIVWNALSKDFGEEEARKYLEKIVRVEVKVPKPEHSSLSDMFRTSLIDITGGLTPEQEGEIGYVFENWGRRYLETPRAINRVCDNIAFMLSGARFELHLTDLVILSIIKIGSPEYYRFIEDYITAWAYRVHSGGSSVHGAPEKFQERFDTIAKNEGFDPSMELIMMARHLPGLAKFSSNDGKSRFLNGRSEEANVVSERRLAAADYGRGYFALQQPSVAPGEEQVAELFEQMSGSDSEVITDQIRNMISQLEPDEFLQLLDRVKARFQGRADDKWAPSRLFTALCSTGTELIEFASTESWRRPISWSLVGDMLASGQPMALRPQVKDAFRRIKDPSWACDLLGSERENQDRGLGAKRALDDEALSWMHDVLIRKLEAMKVAQIIGSARAESIWFYWLFSEPRDFAAFLKKRTRKNSDLLLFLDSFWTRSSGGENFIDRKRILDIYDVDSLEARMIRLVTRRDELGEDARRIAQKLRGWEDDRLGEPS